MVKKRTRGKFMIEGTDCNRRPRIFEEIEYMAYFWADKRLGPLRHMARNHLNRMIKARHRLEMLNTPKQYIDKEYHLNPDYIGALKGLQRLQKTYEMYKELYFICKRYIDMIEEYERISNYVQGRRN